MRRGARLVGALGVACLAACETLLVEPAAIGTEVQFSFESLANSHGATYGDLTPGLAAVRQIQFRFVHDGIARDTMVHAVPLGASVRSRVLLRSDEARGWLEVQAELQTGGGEPLFSGRGLVQTLTTSPHVSVELVPIASFMSAFDPPDLRALGDTIVLQATVYFTSATEIEGAAIDWEVSDPAVASVIGGGLLVSRSNGSTTLRASSLGVERTLSVRVRQVPVTLTGVGPADTTVSIGASFQARPFGQDGNGHPLLPGAGVAWTAQGVVSVDAQGIVTANASGAGSVDVTFGSTVHTMQVTVTP